MEHNDLYAILKESHKLLTMLEDEETGNALHPEAERQLPMLHQLREQLFELFGGVHDEDTFELLEKPGFYQWVKEVDPDFSAEMVRWYSAH